MEHGRFCLTKVLHVVWFDADGKGHVDKLPVGSTVAITGGRLSPGFIEISHDGRLCHAFEDDFRDRSMTAARAIAANSR